MSEEWDSKLKWCKKIQMSESIRIPTPSSPISVGSHVGQLSRQEMSGFGLFDTCLAIIAKNLRYLKGRNPNLNVWLFLGMGKFPYISLTV